MEGGYHARFAVERRPAPEPPASITEPRSRWRWLGNCTAGAMDSTDRGIHRCARSRGSFSRQVDHSDHTHYRHNCYDGYYRYHGYYSHHDDLRTSLA
jgi:hypothetical protein